MNQTPTQDELRFYFHDSVGKSSYSIYLDVNPITWRHRAYSSRGSRCDDVSRTESHNPGYESNQKGNREN